MVLVQSEAQLSHQIKNIAFYKQLLWDASEPQYSWLKEQRHLGLPLPSTVRRAPLLCNAWITISQIAISIS